MMLSALREKFEEKILFSVEKMGEKNLLRESCVYALKRGGKRLRPLIVLLTAEALGFGLDVWEAALAVEYFHTASLIADDLPCMDDDEERRGRPSLHKMFGESVALLASYTLIAAGYGGIYENGKRMGGQPGADKAVLLALEGATRCAGLRGATLGQFYDLQGGEMDWEKKKRVVDLKTGTLFEIAFLFGWLFGGGKVELLGKLRECAYGLGLAFQLKDDIEDGEIEREWGKEMVEKEGEKLKRRMGELGLWTPLFEELLGSCLFRSWAFIE